MESFGSYQIVLNDNSEETVLGISKPTVLSGTYQVVFVTTVLVKLLLFII